MLAVAGIDHHRFGHPRQLTQIIGVDLSIVECAGKSTRNQRVLRQVYWLGSWLFLQVPHILLQYRDTINEEKGGSQPEVLTNALVDLFSPIGRHLRGLHRPTRTLK